MFVTIFITQQQHNISVDINVLQRKYIHKIYIPIYIDHINRFLPRHMLIAHNKKKRTQ